MLITKVAHISERESAIVVTFGALYRLEGFGGADFTI